MFAFAIVDRIRRRMFLARDFFGIKPLYYARPAGGFAFASEIKALRPLVSGRVRADRLFDYLRDGLTDHGDDTLLPGRASTTRRRTGWKWTSATRAD